MTERTRTTVDAIDALERRLETIDLTLGELTVIARRMEILLARALHRF